MAIRALQGVAVEGCTIRIREDVSGRCRPLLLDFLSLLDGYVTNGGGKAWLWRGAPSASVRM
eukprot:scaffold80218_cov21-Tisochrysis_lutea.AAC.1